jgi:hypothetical protein
MLSKLFQATTKQARKVSALAKRNKLSIRHRRSQLGLECLDGRLMMAPLVADVLAGNAATQISGRLFSDDNRNNVADGGEKSLSGWTVFLDLDGSGTRNTDAAGTLEPISVTGSNGTFSINHLVPGTYRIQELVQSGWTPTTPASADVVVALNGNTVNNFGNFAGGAIEGTLFNDVNLDGVWNTDPATGAFTESTLAGWTMYLDLNNNQAKDASEPLTVTDANGHYAFNNLPPQQYRVAEVLKPGWNETLLGRRQTVNVAALSDSVADFGDTSSTFGVAQGTIWDDVNLDGIRATDPVTGTFTEPGLPGWTVYLDVNANGIKDATDPSAVTDSTGYYAITNAPEGTFQLREVLQLGWLPTTTFTTSQTVATRVAKVTTVADFANFSAANGSLSGNIWNDINRNSVRDINALTGLALEPGLANWKVFLDLNRNRTLDADEPFVLTDANGDYSFLDRQVGEYSVQEILPSGWETAAGFSDTQLVKVNPGLNTIAQDFANYNVSVIVPGSVTGTIWNDSNVNGVRDLTPTAEPGLGGWTVFVDTNGDKILSAGEPSAVTASDGTYAISGVTPGSVTIVVQATPGWRATFPSTSSRTISLRNAGTTTGNDFGEVQILDSGIFGTVYADTNGNGIRDVGEKGVPGVTVYLDLNNNGTLDAGEPSTTTATDQFFTPTVDESGTYSFTHLGLGTYTVRAVMPALLSATPAAQTVHTVVLGASQVINNIDTAAQYRANEIHGVRFVDSNGNRVRDLGEPGQAGITVYIDSNRNGVRDPGEPTTTTAADGSYSFTGLTPGKYVIRDEEPIDYLSTYPKTIGGVLWPAGTSNPAVGIVNPTSITTVLANGESYRQTVSLTLPTGHALTNQVDVFLLFDDTGSFTGNSPIVRAAFPDIISSLQTSLPGTDFGFGVGRFEEYGNFAAEFSSGRPFILNQPVVSNSTPGYLAAIQSALNRTAPGYGGDQPETDIEALYQLVTGKGFDGNNNGTTTDSGAAGLASTQVTPGNSGDVPAFGSFVVDTANGGLAPSGNVGGGGFRAGALPIVLLATDTGFAYQPKGETSITGVGGVTLPLASLTQLSRPTTPFNSGAGIQETVTGLNALGALVIGLGTNAVKTLDPRQQLESLAKLTGSVNNTTATIPNGTPTPIAPGDPFYFQIASGFGPSVANGVVSAIQNAATNVAVDITLQASDPRVHIINHTGVVHGVGSGQTASFDVEFVGDGAPRRFDLQFVRSGTNVVLGSIPVVIGTPIVTNYYEYDELAEGEIHGGDDFGGVHKSLVTLTPSSLGVSTGATTIMAGTSRQIDATVFDQFDAPLSSPGAVSWSSTGTSGSVSATGLFSASAATGSATITATLGAITSSAAVSIVPWQATVTSAADSGPGTLREALTSAALAPGVTHTINFTLPAGPQTITPSTPLSGTTDPIIVSLDATQNVTIGTGSGLSWDNFTSFTKTGAGFLAIGGAQTAHPAGSTMAVQGGTLELLSSAGPNVSLAVGNATGTPTLLFGATQTVNDITVTANGTAGIVASGSTTTLGPQAALVAAGGAPSGYVPGDKYVSTNTLSVASGGHFDVNDGVLVVNNGNQALLNALVQHGNPRSTGVAGNFHPDQGELLSSTANYDYNSLNGITTLGWVDNFDTGYKAINGSDALLKTGSQITPPSANGLQYIFKYVYSGDTNLDGKANNTDLSNLVSNYNQTLNGGTGNPVTAFDGDFNGDGMVDSKDLAILVGNYNSGTTGSSFSPLLPSVSSAASTASLAATDLALAALPADVVPVDAATLDLLATPLAKKRFAF